MTRFIRALGLVMALAGISAVPAAAGELPIFDAHLHYNWEPDPRMPLDEVLALFRQAGVRGILANSRPNDGTRALAESGAEGLVVVPFLRPYRTRADVLTWFDDPTIPPFIAQEFSRARYAGIGEFHVFGQGATTEVVRQVVAFAAARGLVLFAHCDIEALDHLFARAPDIRLLWAHTGFGTPTADVAERLRRHPTLRAELSYRSGITDASGRLTTEWRELFQAFPDRFVVGSDTWVDARWDDYRGIIATYRGWLAQLPLPLAEAIAHRNAESFLRVR